MGVHTAIPRYYTDDLTVRIPFDITPTASPRGMNFSRSRSPKMAQNLKKHRRRDVNVVENLKQPH